MKCMSTTTLVIFFLMSGGCATAPPATESLDGGITWTRYSAEYRAVSMQVFRAATQDLPGYLADTNWSALPSQWNAAALPPAIILDVDETALTNPVFQSEFERPFTDAKLDNWSIEHTATAAPGAKTFLQYAIDRGVQVFFVTNRPCMPKPGTQDPCPQKTSVVDDLLEAGLPATHDNVSLSGERPEWDKEKQRRRDHIAQSHRVVMLFGDDLSDFIPCVRRSPAGDCDEPATAASRRELLMEHQERWGAGWYILPNPMHGSWTSFQE